MFGLSGLFTLLAVAGLLVTAVAYRQDFRQVYRPVLFGSILVFLLAEGWFLSGVAVVGAALKRPRTSRAVGLAILVAGVVGGLAIAGTRNEWKVEMSGRLPSLSLMSASAMRSRNCTCGLVGSVRSRITRSRISCAALFVKVTARRLCGATCRSEIR